MRYDKIQHITINKLLNKYERSKTFTGTNQVTQNIDKKIGELFPKYVDDAEYEYFCDVNDALKDLEQLGLICLKYHGNNVISRVVLNLELLDESYQYVNREPKKEEYEWIEKTLEQFRASPVLDSYIEMQYKKIAKNQKVEYFDGNKDEYFDLLRIVKELSVKELSVNEEEQFIRDFSMRLFKDSKRVEKLAARASALMYQYGDYQDKDAVLEECGVVRTPTYVSMKGKAVLTIGTQIIDLSRWRGDIALSTTSLKELCDIRVEGKRVVTVENLTSFHDYEAVNDFVIYLGGFHNKTKRKFLLFLHQRNPGKEYRHFGDIDAGGFYILEHLKAKTAIPFRSMHMNVETLKRFTHQTKKLTGNDRKRIENLLVKLNGVKDGLSEDYREVLQFMLEHDCKLEQEAVH